MRGPRILIDKLSLQIHPGWRIGVVGANGSGKSSLFALLRGEIHQEQGDLDIPSAWVVAHVAQETPALSTSALDYVLDGDVELRKIQAELAQAEAEDIHHDGHRVGELHARLQEIEGYAAHSRAGILLHGLGFSDADFTRAVSDFSGGWRMRLNLAQALMCRSDLLLLDEPTNHLDLDAVIWLEKWLATYRGTLLLISHDRDFIDGSVTHLAHIDQQKLTLYTGNYSDFEVQHAAHLAQQQAMYEKQQREKAHLQKYIDRFRAQATKARQAQSRIKAMARMELVTAAHVDTPFTFSFMEPARAPDPMITLSDAKLGYGEKTILEKIKLTLRPGARLGLLGPNGAGKSTFIKLLANEIKAQSGQVLFGKDLSIGYFAQHQLEQLRADESPLQHLQRQEPQSREQDLRDYLGGFDFRGDMVSSAIANFSGGEKSRLALALLIRRRPNLLLLDEPTNHLDLDMHHALTKALAEYDGSMVLVSHDRSLLRTVCNDFLLIVDGRADPFDGDIDDYLVWLNERRVQQSASGGSEQQAQDKATRVQARADAAADRQAKILRRRPLVKELEQLEKKLATWQGEKKLLDERLTDESLYAGGQNEQLQTLLKRQGELASYIDAGEERWLEVQGELEEIGEV